MTTLKILRKMTEKWLVRRNESPRSLVYETVRKAPQTQRQFVTDELEENAMRRKT